MTVYRCEAFNGASTNTDVDDYLPRHGYDHWTDDGTVITGRLSGVALRCYGARFWRIPVTAAANYTIGFAIRVEAWLTSTEDKFLYLTSDAGVNEHITLSFVPNGEIAVATQTDTVYTSGLRGKNDSWMFIEFKFTISNSVGAYTLKVNGKTYLNRINIDTYSAGIIGIDEFDFDYGGGGSDSFYIDDLYIADDFLGDIRIDRIDPDGDGAVNDGAPLGVGDSYVEVDDGNAVDDDTTYILSVTGNQDLFTYDDLSVLGTIRAVQMNVVCRETDGSPFLIEQLVRIATTIYDETPITIVDTNYEIINRVMSVDPATTIAWTLSAINAAQFGFEVTT